MCGIVGIVGDKPVSGRILESLKRLEYRGYDSAGIATLSGGQMHRRRAVGKLSTLAEKLADDPIDGEIGIGHTRWATHGGPNEVNAHPHVAGRVAVVHNGIIENFAGLRAELETSGRVFSTETDTEVVAHLCDAALSRGLAPADAVRETLESLEGAFALLFLFDGAENLMIAARRGSPLAIGFGDGEMYVGSDALALGPMSSKICYLEEGDWACVTRESAQIFDDQGRPADRAVRNVSRSSSLVEKGEYRHYMAKEIHEQPAVIGYTLGHYLNPGRTKIASPADQIDWAAVDRLTLVACGTAYYACAVAKYWFESTARLPVELDVASEFRYREPPMPKNGVAIVLSQSGETADTLAALRYAKAQNQTTLAVVNVPESTIARESDIIAQTLAGPEISVASTKAFTCQLMTLATIVISAARARSEIDADTEREMIGHLSEAPRLIAEAIAVEDSIEPICLELSRARDVLYLGRGAMYPLAMEGALKLKELSYIHAEGYASGEMKHGPIALIDPSVPIVAMAPKNALFEKTVSNLQEAMARGGRVVLITDPEGAEAAKDSVWRTVVLPKTDPFIAPIIYAAPAQLLAYHTAVAKGTDVDQPRNLAKSVTVE